MRCFIILQAKRKKNVPATLSVPENQTSPQQQVENSKGHRANQSLIHCNHRYSETYIKNLFGSNVVYSLMKMVKSMLPDRQKGQNLHIQNLKSQITLL